jgi:hypothetical protein
VFGRSDEAVLAALGEQRARTGFLGSTHLAALALYAAALSEHRAAAFSIT